MISTISSPFTPAMRASNQSQPAPTPQPAPAPQPAPPQDGIDLSTIDCPYKAAQLPLLEPSFQLGVTAAIALAVMSAMGGGHQTPAISLAFQSATGANQIGVNYSVDASNQNSPLNAQGSLTGSNGQSTAISGGLAFNQSNQSVTWTGKFAGNDEAFTFSLNQGNGNDQAPSINMKGQTGSIPVNLNFGIIGDLNHGQDGVKGYSVDGTVGDLKYHTDNTVTPRPDLSSMPQPQPGQNIDLGTMSVRGQIGDRPIAKDYTVGAVMNSQDSGTLTAKGSGVNAGVTQSSINTTLTVGNVKGAMAFFGE